MAFPVTAALLDDFNRANGPVQTGAAQWSAGAINGATNELLVAGERFATNAGGHNGRSSGSFGPDLEVYFEVPTLPTNGNYIFLAARIQEPGTGNWDGYGLIYIRESGTDIWQLRRYTNGSSTVLGANMTKDLEAGDSIGFSAVGKVLTCYRKVKAGAWETIGTREDATYALGGPVGFEFGDSTAQVDNLFVGTISAGGVLHTLELSDSISLADSLAKRTGKGLEDVVVLSEAIGKRPGHAEADSLALSDAVAKAPGKSLVDPLPLSDVIGKSAGHVEVDAVSLNDEISKGVGHFEADSLALSDSIAKRATKGLVDALALADSLARRVGKAITDLLGLSDSVSTDGGSPPQTPDAWLTVSDAPVTQLVVSDQLVMTLALADAPVTTLNLEDEPA